MFELQRGFAYRCKDKYDKWLTYYLAAEYRVGDTQPTNWKWVLVSGDRLYPRPSVHVDPMWVRQTIVTGWSTECPSSSLRLVYVKSGGSTVGQFPPLDSGEE